MQSPSLASSTRFVGQNHLVTIQTTIYYYKAPLYIFLGGQGSQLEDTLGLQVLLSSPGPSSVLLGENVQIRGA